MGLLSSVIRRQSLRFRFVSDGSCCRTSQWWGLTVLLSIIIRSASLHLQKRESVWTFVYLRWYM